jgi:hypothetical protein
MLYIVQFKKGEKDMFSSTRRRIGSVLARAKWYVERGSDLARAVQEAKWELGSQEWVWGQFPESVAVNPFAASSGLTKTEALLLLREAHTRLMST